MTYVAGNTANVFHQATFEIAAPNSSFRVILRAQKLQVRNDLFNIFIRVCVSVCVCV